MLSTLKWFSNNTTERFEVNITKDTPRSAIPKLSKLCRGRERGLQESQLTWRFCNCNLHAIDSARSFGNAFFWIGSLTLKKKHTPHWHWRPLTLKTYKKTRFLKLCGPKPKKTDKVLWPETYKKHLDFGVLWPETYKSIKIFWALWASFSWTIQRLRWVQTEMILR